MTRWLLQFWSVLPGRRNGWRRRACGGLILPLWQGRNPAVVRTIIALDANIADDESEEFSGLREQANGVAE
jgi:hypothetical protein